MVHKVLDRTWNWAITVVMTTVLIKELVRGPYQPLLYRASHPLIPAVVEASLTLC